MDKERLDQLWEQVEHIGKVVRLKYDAMLALGSVFGEMRSTIEKQQEEIERLKSLLEEISMTVCLINVSNGDEMDKRSKARCMELASKRNQ